MVGWQVLWGDGERWMVDFCFGDRPVFWASFYEKLMQSEESHCYLGSIKAGEGSGWASGLCVET